MTYPESRVTVITHICAHGDKLDEFKRRCKEFVEVTSTEDKCLFIDVAFDGQNCITHEGYANADGVLDHIEHVRLMMEENLTMVELDRVELCGPSNELDKLREALTAYSPVYYCVEFSFRRSANT